MSTVSMDDIVKAFSLCKNILLAHHNANDWSCKIIGKNPDVYSFNFPEREAGIAFLKILFSKHAIMLSNGVHNMEDMISQLNPVQSNHLKSRLSEFKKQTPIAPDVSSASSLINNSNHLAPAASKTNPPEYKLGKNGTFTVIDTFDSKVSDTITSAKSTHQALNGKGTTIDIEGVKATIYSPNLVHRDLSIELPPNPSLRQIELQKKALAAHSEYVSECDANGGYHLITRNCVGAVAVALNAMDPNICVANTRMPWSLDIQAKRYKPKPVVDASADKGLANSMSSEKETMSPKFK